MSQGALFAAAEREEAPVVACYGAGVDSTAKLVDMVEAGERVDVAIFADTGAEKGETYAYLALFGAWLAARGVRLVCVRYEPKSPRNWPAYASLDEECITNGTLPGASVGMHTCSMKWKIEAQHRWVRQWEPAQRAWAAGLRVVKLVGFDCSREDDARTAKAERIEAASPDPFYETRYPLRERGWNREQCEARILAAGLPLPVKSACYFCIASKCGEVRELHPGLLRRIVLVEARSEGRLTSVEGLWRTTVKGTRGGVARPGSMTQFIRDEGLLSADDIERVRALAPHGNTPAKAPAEDAVQRLELADAADEDRSARPVAARSDWQAFMAARHLFDAPGVPSLYAHLADDAAHAPAAAEALGETR